MIETVDAEPLQFNLNTNKHRQLSYTPSLSSMHSYVSSSSATSDEGISLEDLQYYLEHLKTRPSDKLPPVAGGLLPLEVMNIPFYDPLQVKFNPNEHQKQTQLIEAKRGPRYMLTYLMRKLGYRPASMSGRDNNLRPMLTGQSQFSTDTLTTVASNSTATYSMMDEGLPHIGPVQSLSQRQPRDTVMSRLRTKVSMMVKKPSTSSRSPAASAHEATGNTSDSDTSFIGSAPKISVHISPTPTITPTPSNCKPTIPAPSIHQVITPTPSTTLQPAFTARGAPSPNHQFSVQSPPKKKNKRAPSILSFVTSRQQNQNPIRRIRRKQKYLSNVGTINIKGYRKKDFDLIIDPKFPYSFIDIDTIIRENATEGSNNLLSGSFRVVATPVYNPESEHNRVCVEVQLVPMSMAMEQVPMSVAIELQNGFTPQTPTQEMNRGSRKPHSSPTTGRRNSSQSSRSRNNKNGSADAKNRQSPKRYPTFGNPGTYTFLQSWTPPSQNQVPGESMESRALRLENEAFASKWFDESKEIITLMNLTPFKCILGKDWLDKVFEFAYAREHHEGAMGINETILE